MAKKQFKKYVCQTKPTTTPTNKYTNARNANNIIQIYDLLITIYPSAAAVAFANVVVRICGDDELTTRHHNCIWKMFVFICKTDKRHKRRK